jgi:hypothetical protein
MIRRKVLCPYWEPYSRRPKKKMKLAARRDQLQSVFISAPGSVLKWNFHYSTWWRAVQRVWDSVLWSGWDL